MIIIEHEQLSNPYREFVFQLHITLTLLPTQNELACQEAALTGNDRIRLAPPTRQEPAFHLRRIHMQGAFAASHTK